MVPHTFYYALIQQTNQLLPTIFQLSVSERSQRQH